jgi:hypothetical protein
MMSKYREKEDRPVPCLFLTGSSTISCAAHTEHLLETSHRAVRDTVHYKPLRSALLGAAYQKIELADAAKHCAPLTARLHDTTALSATQDNTDLM